MRFGVSLGLTALKIDCLHFLFRNKRLHGSCRTTLEKVTLFIIPSLFVCVRMRLKQDVSPVVVIVFRLVVWLYSLISYLPYMLLRSSESQSFSECSRRVKARSVSGHPSGPYRDVEALRTLATCLQPGVNTLDRVFESTVCRFPHFDCLGTRDLLSEEDETQEDERVFKKVRIRVHILHVSLC